MENENAFMQQFAGALVALMEPEIEKRFQNYGDTLESELVSEIESQMESTLPAEVEDQVYAQLDDRMADAIESALTDKLQNYAVTDARVEKAVADALPGVLRAALVDLFKPVATIREDGALVFTLSSHWGK